MTHDCCAGQYDLAVIGAGSAGFSAAIAATEQGARVALIGHGTIGGTCVNVGCVPSKNLIRAAEAVRHANTASRFDGVRAEAQLENWRALVSQKDALVASLRESKYVNLLPGYEGIDYLEGCARIADGGISVNSSLIQADKLIIATGARPAVPPIPGLDQVPYLTSTTAMELDELPKSMIVIGGGYVGCEQAQLFARLGVRVTIVCRSRILPAVEPEVSDALTQYLRAEGITVRCGIAYRQISRSALGVALDVAEDEKHERLEAESVLVATGRAPNTEGLGLEEVGIELEHGAIRVDDRMRTSRPRTYAAGDVTGHDQFVYMAAYGARVAAENALNGDNRRYDNKSMPWVIFTDPQVAGVGLTEADARGQGYEVRASVLSLDHLPRALAARDTRGLIKLVADAKDGRLLGAQILAPEGGDSIQTASLAIRHGLTVTELAESVFPYLTTVEGLKLAAQAFEKDVSKLSCCA